MLQTGQFYDLFTEQKTPAVLLSFSPAKTMPREDRGASPCPCMYILFHCTNSHGINQRNITFLSPFT